MQSVGLYHEAETDNCEAADEATKIYANDIA